jgi:cobalt-zinc-cadmium efflux system membrane fusion protein
LSSRNNPDIELGGEMGTEAKTERRSWWRIVLLVGLCLLGGGAYFLVEAHPEWNPFAESKKPDAGEKQSLAVELVKGDPNTLFVPEQVRKALGMEPVAVAKAPEQGRDLVLPGSLALDPTRIYRVRVRFNAEVLELKSVQDPKESRERGFSFPFPRDIRAGDKVKEGDVLAVVKSVDVGSRKSDLLDALVQVRLDERRLKARIELFKEGSIPEDTLNQTRRDVIAGRSAADRAERTLRTWMIPDNEIEAVYKEADEILAREGKRDVAKEKLWPRSELLAPRAGVIVERNIGVGEFLTDTTQNLFTIADISRMLVVAYPSEDQLQHLLELSPEEKVWSITTINSPVVKAPIDEISQILDPNMHTGVVKGYIENPHEKLRAGQLVSTRIRMKPPGGVVEVELTALVEDGKYSYVFVQTDPEKHHYTLQRVLVKQRFEQKAYVLSELTDEQRKLTPEEEKRGLLPAKPLAVGARYIASGALELRQALDDQLARVRAAR